MSAGWVAGPVGRLRCEAVGVAPYLGYRVMNIILNMMNMMFIVMIVMIVMMMWVKTYEDCRWF